MSNLVEPNGRLSAGPSYRITVGIDFEIDIRARTEQKHTHRLSDWNVNGFEKWLELDVEVGRGGGVEGWRRRSSVVTPKVRESFCPRRERSFGILDFRTGSRFRDALGDASKLYKWETTQNKNQQMSKNNFHPSAFDSTENTAHLLL